MGERVFRCSLKAFVMAMALWGLSGCEAGFGDTTEQETTAGAAYENSDPQLNSNCTPSCAFKECGNDGCGNSCGACGAGELCNSFQCWVDDGTLIDESVPDNDPNSWVNEDTSDDDGDQVPASQDNCPTVYNPDQADLDGDWVGDICDPDRDQDGYLNELDCAPDNEAVSPGADELCHNDIDDNCNSEVDEENASDCTDYFVDMDTDGTGASTSLRCLCYSDGDHTAKIGGDCDDGDSAYSPLLPEICDGLDNNCNELTDEGCDDDGDGYCDSTLEMADGHIAVCPKGGGDCYDYSPLVNPAAEEIEGNGLDDNCDGKMEGEPETGNIVPNCGNLACTGATLGAALCAMEICYGNISELTQNASVTSPTTDDITGAWSAMDHYGHTSNDLAPFAGPSYFAMATGLLSAPDPVPDSIQLEETGGDCDVFWNSAGGSSSPPLVPADCAFGEISDCDAQCATESYLGDGMCDDGITFSDNFNCAEFAYDNGDCMGGTTGSAAAGCSDPFASDGYQFKDAVEFEVTLQAPPGATGFSVDYIFMSQEYEEWIGTSFNDKFYIILEASQTTGGEPTVINFTQCSDPYDYHDYVDSQGNMWCFIAINTAFSEPCSSPSTDISGTGFECDGAYATGSSTGWLTTAWPIAANETFTLRFHIHDTSDEAYDSAVLIDNFRFEGGVFETGTATHK